jgi:hypothetical protein
VLFFSNEDNTVFEFKSGNLEELLYEVSFKITWIGAFSLWDTDCDNLISQMKFCKTRLWQVWKLCDLLSKGRKVIVFSGKWGTVQVVNKKNISYGLYQIFYKNYFSILHLFVEQRCISPKQIQWLEKDLLFHFFTDWIIQWEINNIHLQYSTEENLKKLVFDEYRNKKYFSRYLRYYTKRKIEYRIKTFIKMILHLR